MPSDNVVSNKLPHDIEMERKKALLAKVAQVKVNLLQDKGKVRPADPTKPLNPNIKYVWVNKNENRVVSFQGLDYKIVKDPNVLTDWKREDGSHIYGDLILMQVDREWYDGLKLHSQMKAIEGVEGEAVFAAFAERNGIRAQIPKS